MTNLQHDLETLNLSEARIFFSPGEIQEDKLEKKIGLRVKSGMEKQYGWILDVSEAAYMDGWIDVRVTNGLEVGAISIKVPDEVFVV